MKKRQVRVKPAVARMVFVAVAVFCWDSQGASSDPEGVAPLSEQGEAIPCASWPTGADVRNGACGRTVGACCAADGSCTPDLSPQDCDTTGGAFLGVGTTCAPNCCPPPETETGADAACDIYACHDGTDWVAPYDLCGASDPGDPDCDVSAGETCLLRATGPTEYAIDIPTYGDPPNVITFMGDSSGHEPYFTSEDGDDCNLGSAADPGWYESFVVTNNDGPEYDCAVVTLDLCCTDPIHIPAYIVMKDCCPCPGGSCWVELDRRADGSAKYGWGPDCEVEVDGVEYCCQEGNFVGQFMVRSGRHSWQIATGRICEGTMHGCETDDDCDPGVSCVDVAGPYTGHITVEACPRAACCLNACSDSASPNLVPCWDDSDCPGAGATCNTTCEVRTRLTCDLDHGQFLKFESGTEETCSPNPCVWGVCLFPDGVCDDSVAFDTEVECEAFGGVFYGGITCDLVPFGCPFESSSTCKEECPDSEIVMSDLANEIRIADDFRPAGTQIGEICWTAGYYGGNDEVGEFECSSNPPWGAWVVRFYQDNAGLPGTEVGPAGGQEVIILASNHHGGTSRLWDYHAILPSAVDVNPGDCYWMELTGNGEGPDGCHTYLSTAIEGNDYSMWDNLEYGSYGPEDANNVDIVFCLDTGLSGTTDCDDVVAACCTCPGCTPDLTESECVSDLAGVWRLGHTCATAACPDVAPHNDDCENAEIVAGMDSWRCRGGLNDGDPCDIANCHSDCPDDGDDIGRCIGYRIITFDNVCAARENEPPTSCGGVGDLHYDVWYRFTPQISGVLTVSLCPSDVSDGALWDTMIAVYDTVTCPVTAGDEIKCGDDECDFAGPSEITPTTVYAGLEYLIRIGGWSSPATYGNPRGWGEVEFSFADG